MAEQKQRRGLNTEAPQNPTMVPPAEPNTARNEGNPQAQATPKEQQRAGALGMQLPEAGEIAAGEIVKEVFADDTPGRDPNHAANLVRMARSSSLMKQMAGDSRPVDEWGLVGKCDDPDCAGDTWRGHGILLDIASMQKIRAHDGAVLREGIYANTRNFSQGLVTGDFRKNLRGG